MGGPRQRAGTRGGEGMASVTRRLGKHLDPVAVERARRALEARGVAGWLRYGRSLARALVVPTAGGPEASAAPP